MARRSGVRAKDLSPDRRLRVALERVQVATAEERIDALARLVRCIRPAKPDRLPEAEERLEALIKLLRENTPLRDGMRDCLLGLLSDKQPLRLFTDSGVLAHEGFFGGLQRRVAQKILPEEHHTESLRGVLNLLFPLASDYRWVCGLSEDLWIRLLDALDLPAARFDGGPMQHKIVEALQVLSYRIAAMGLETELVRNHPDIERYESPFLRQNVELRDFIESRQAAPDAPEQPVLDDKHLLVLLDQCSEILARVRKQASRGGASVTLTHLLVRLRQSSRRLKTLLRLLEDRPAHELNVDRVRLFQELVSAENQRLSLSRFWSQNLELLSASIVGNASRTGEHYITATRSEYFGMLRSALGAGFIVAFMALLKINLGGEAHAPLVEAVLYSLNYGLGFVLIYLLHFTIATKQPAMTASHIAASLQKREQGHRLDGLVELLVRVARSQFIAIVGNVVMAFAIPVLIAMLMVRYGGAAPLDAAHAQALLDDQNPLISLAWFHAAIAGVFLFLSGLISGYFDNKAAYDRIPQRLRQLYGLRRMLGERGANRLADYVGNNLGGLAGNFFFGCMLGSMGAIGLILGLPLDIRHITFSTAYLGYGFVALDWALQPRTYAILAIGVAGIGVINLAVSFGLALAVAMRAQQVRFGEGGELLKRLLHWFLRRPQDFFWPPADREETKAVATEP